MPAISLFFGIKITINSDDHNPPHVHVSYGEFKAALEIENCRIIKGYLPNSQMKKVLAWAEIHKAELMQNWALVHEGEMPNKIQPLM